MAAIKWTHGVLNVLSSFWSITYSAGFALSWKVQGSLYWKPRVCDHIPTNWKVSTLPSSSLFTATALCSIINEQGKASAPVEFLEAAGGNSVCLSDPRSCLVLPFSFPNCWDLNLSISVKPPVLEIPRIWHTRFGSYLFSTKPLQIVEFHFPPLSMLSL